MSVSVTVDGVAYDVPSNASDTNWAAAQVAFEQALATAINRALAAPSWTALSLVNGWAASGTVVPAYYVDPLGFVHLRGALAGGTTGTVCATLPVDARPNALSGTVVLGALAADGICSASIPITGQITLADIGSSDVATYVSFFGLSFSNAA